MDVRSSASASLQEVTFRKQRCAFTFLCDITLMIDIGAQKVGSIVANMNFLRDEGLIEPQFPSVYSTHSSSQKQHWETHYEVAMIVEGRSIRFEARWPLKKNLKQGQEQRVLVMKLVGIAAAFQPGTA